MDGSPVHYQSRRRYHFYPAYVVLTIPHDNKNCCHPSMECPYSLILSFPTPLSNALKAHEWFGLGPCSSPSQSPNYLSGSFLPFFPKPRVPPLNLSLLLPITLEWLVSLSASPNKSSSRRVGAMCYSSLYPQHLALCLIHSKHAINVEERKKEKEGRER